MSQATTAHIHLDERGRAWIDDTNTKVIEVVLDQRAYWLEPRRNPLPACPSIHGTDSRRPVVLL
jgi:hypothetical protein